MFNDIANISTIIALLFAFVIAAVEFAQTKKSLNAKKLEFFEEKQETT